MVIPPINENERERNDETHQESLLFALNNNDVVNKNFLRKASTIPQTIPASIRKHTMDIEDDNNLSMAVKDHPSRSNKSSTSGIPENRRLPSSDAPMTPLTPTPLANTPKQKSRSPVLPKKSIVAMDEEYMMPPKSGNRLPAVKHHKVQDLEPDISDHSEQNEDAKSDSESESGSGKGSTRVAVWRDGGSADVITTPSTQLLTIEDVFKRCVSLQKLRNKIQEKLLYLQHKNGNSEDFGPSARQSCMQKAWGQVASRVAIAQSQAMTSKGGKRQKKNTKNDEDAELFVQKQYAVFKSVDEMAKALAFSYADGYLNKIQGQFFSNGNHVIFIPRKGVSRIIATVEVPGVQIFRYNESCQCIQDVYSELTP